MRRSAPLVMLLGAGSGVGCDLLFTPHFETRVEVTPLTLAPVMQARAVSARTFLLPSGSDDARPLELPDAVFGDCLDGEDVLGRLPLDFGLVQVGPATLRFAGRELLQLEDSRVPVERTRGMMIRPLYDVLVEKREMAQSMVEHGCTPWRRRHEAPAFNGQLLLAVDQGVPFETLSAVMYTAGQADFYKHYFLVQGPVQGTLEKRTAPLLHTDRRENSDPPLQLVVGLDAQGLVVNHDGTRFEDPVRLPCPGERCVTADDYDLAALRTVLGEIKDDWPDENEVVLALEDGVSFAALARVQDACAGTRSRELFPWGIVAMSSEDDPTPVRGLAASPHGFTILPDDTLSVLPSYLPEMHGYQRAPEFSDQEREELFSDGFMEGLGGLEGLGEPSGRGTGEGVP